MWIYNNFINYAAAVPESLIFGVILILIVFILIITFTIYYLYKIISSQRRRKYTGSEAVINAVGTATNNIAQNAGGFITIDGVSWEVINSGEEDIEKYDKVLVTGRSGLKLMVKKLKK
ncbi:NfeD family protein [Ferroplasma sp.]|uniref:NfeD family protein n=1 Tax=Ferroplasma sp. TaxID=2591003 RepID=UPI00307F1838